jgi:AraC family transcriptional regulator of adaptative response / DNA-3-methyladenine glycosylase II
MNLDREMCSRARLARDARFDGQFYIAVLSTRIYCRPICPSRTSREENVRYFPTAAAAAEAGFRPCLRCRPECSPGTPASFGTSNTVSRALRLIGETGLEEGGVEILAERLGIGPRHLRRLFLRYLGATPSAVAQTRRLQFAKKLIDETALPMTEIAFASGFGCVRRFNAAIRRTYRRTPTQIRRLARQPAVQAGGNQLSAIKSANQYLFRLHFRPPLAWSSMLAFLAHRATPGVEVVEGGTYRRSISLNGTNGYVEVCRDDANHSLLVRLDFADPRSLFLIIERIRAMFDLNADWATIVQTLRADLALAPHLDCDPGLRVPGCWNAFELATLAILSQRTRRQRAASMASRIATTLGKPLAGAPGITHVFPTPEVLADADLLSIAVPAGQAQAIRSLSRAVCDGKIRFQLNADTDSLLASLGELPGIDGGTAQYIAMRTLREPDSFPSADLGLIRSLNLKNSRELAKRAEAWRPWRAYAAMYLWNSHPPQATGAGVSESLPSPIRDVRIASDEAGQRTLGTAAGRTVAGAPMRQSKG